VSKESERTQELIQSILTGIKELMGTPIISEQIRAQVNSELKAIDSQVYGIVDLIEEGE